MADGGDLPAGPGPAAQDWVAAVQFVAAQMRLRALQAPDVVVLVPYAQLIHAARSAWVHAFGPGLLPRFESTLNWTRDLGGALPSPEDIRFDAALDGLTAQGLLVRSGQMAHRAVLGPRVMEAAWSLAPQAAAIEPARRSAWGAQMAAHLTATGALPQRSPLLEFEAVVARVALAWAAHSAFATDVLLGAEPALLVVLDGFQADPMTEALQDRLGDRCLRWPLSSAVPAQPALSGVQLYPAVDAEDEVQRAAACVLAHLAAGRLPVALVALDRQLTRRVGALLIGQGVSIRDETGWRLSTTRAAASLMALLRAAEPEARTDDVLDWLKCAPRFASEQVQVLEHSLRRRGVREWAAVPSSLPLVETVNAIRACLQPPQSIGRFVQSLHEVLQDCGMMATLEADAAGCEVLQALHLQADTEDLFNVYDGMGPSLTLSDFSAWVRLSLECANFSPPHPDEHQVLILPLAQLLGRDVQAVVLAGCDETRLQVSPDSPGPWTPAQRAILGLPPREALAAAHRAAWHHALRAPQVDVLWRCSDLGEPASPSAWVQLLELEGARRAADPRRVYEVPPHAVHMPRPVAPRLRLSKLSASAYADLRQCPYKYFALRQLGLSEDAELDEALDKRDFGTWLHQVLHAFHEGLLAQPCPAEAEAWVTRLDEAAASATRELALPEAEFLPFAAGWPQVRDAYVRWLLIHVETGGQYLQGEVWKEMVLPLAEGVVTLVGKLDRVDVQADATVLLIDYKTEASSKTAKRIKAGSEDTQLPFYAALFAGQDVSAAYLTLGERDGAGFWVQPDILGMRDALLEGVASDLNRVAAGVPLPALGEGAACGYCAARGLCRKEQWS
ncbi:MAG: hypothetical protein RLZZ126_1602 [Pseudomonadota bacterium]